MTLFDLVEDDQKSEFEIKLPDVGEYAKETNLAFEKVLGIYISGHPLEAYEGHGRGIFPPQRRIFSRTKKPDARSPGRGKSRSSAG